MTVSLSLAFAIGAMLQSMATVQVLILRRALVRRYREYPITRQRVSRDASRTAMILALMALAMAVLSSATYHGVLPNPQWTL